MQRYTVDLDTIIDTLELKRFEYGAYVKYSDVQQLEQEIQQMKKIACEHMQDGCCKPVIELARCKQEIDSMKCCGNCGRFMELDYYPGCTVANKCKNNSLWTKREVV